MLKNIKKEIKTRPLIYLLLFVILLTSIFVRVYNVSRNLGFYYDQGRDALTIWNFVKNGDLFLVGPTTGIAGIFRGPWYYWLITPLYIVGGGNPVYPAIFLSLTTVVAIFFLYLVASEIVNKWAGLLAAIIASFSYYIVVHSRWLSNPTPMLLISILLLWTLLSIPKKKIWTYPLIGFLCGMAIQFGSATEIFYIPIVLILSYIYRKYLPSRKVLVLSVALFVFSFVPQILFDVIKGGPISKAIFEFLVKKESFKLSVWAVTQTRFAQYWEFYTSMLIPGEKNKLLPFILFGLGVIWANPKNFLRNEKFKILLLFITIPALGMLFFQGNYGNVFDYYFSGYYFPLILFFALPLGYAFKNWGGKIVVLIFLFFFFSINTPVLAEFIIKGRTHFTFGHQKKAIEWIASDANGVSYNIDIYVPPVNPYAYDYLLKWTNPIGFSDDKEVPLVYTLYELDPPSPERLASWLTTKETIGIVENQVSFGGITVQRRHRK